MVVPSNQDLTVDWDSASSNHPIIEGPRSIIPKNTDTPSRPTVLASSAPAPGALPNLSFLDASTGERRGSDEGQPKKKSSKSRNDLLCRSGCMTCKARRLKCDEDRPTCRRCADRNVTCGGYRKDFKWRSFGEYNFEPRKYRESESGPSSVADFVITQPGLKSVQVSGFEAVEAAGPFVGSSPRMESSVDRSSPCPVRSSPPAPPPQDSHVRLASNSDEILVLRFDRHTCAILSLMDGPNENPWRTVVWPFAKTCPALYHALLSMTAFHWGSTDSWIRVEGIEHLRKSLGYLRRDLNQMPTELSTMAMLALAFSESWDSPICSGKQHIHAAGILISRLIRKVQVTEQDRAAGGPLQSTVKLEYTDFSSTAALKLTTDTQSNPRMLRFLCATWLYLRTVSRPTTMHTSISTNNFPPDADREAPGPPIILNDITEFKGCNEPTCSDPDYSTSPECSKLLSIITEETGSLDPLMGCASTLFPLIDRVSTLVCQAQSNIAKHSANFIPGFSSTSAGLLSHPFVTGSVVPAARQLHQALWEWSPPPNLSKRQDLICQISHCIATAEAYRYSALLFLRQAYPFLAYEEPVSHNSGTAIDSIPAFDSPISSLFPSFSSQSPFYPSSSSPPKPKPLTAYHLAHVALSYLSTVPLSSSTLIVHTFPLLISGAEIADPPVRQWVERHWSNLSARMRLGLLDKCLEATREVWSRRDTFIDAFSENREWYQQRRQWQHQKHSNSSRDDNSSNLSDSPELTAMTLLELSKSGLLDDLPEFSVAGKLHWLGVMRNRGWEVSLG